MLTILYQSASIPSIICRWLSGMTFFIKMLQNWPKIINWIANVSSILHIRQVIQTKESQSLSTSYWRAETRQTTKPVKDITRRTMLNQAMTVYLFEAKNDYMMSAMYQIVLSRCEGVKWSAKVKALKVCSRMK